MVARMVQVGRPGAEVEPDGRVKVRLPDQPQARHITTWDEFEFRQGRDMWTYAQEMMAAVDQLINEVLSAFEDHIPERFKQA